MLRVSGSYSFFSVFLNVGQRLQASPFENLRKLLEQRGMHQTIRGQGFTAVELKRSAVKSDTLPPASSTISTPAAVSQGLRLNSQNPSKRPLATQHRSRAAEPARRTPWVRKVI